jgi:hypothetical protein
MISQTQCDERGEFEGPVHVGTVRVKNISPIQLIWRLYYRAQTPAPPWASLAPNEEFLLLESVISPEQDPDTSLGLDYGIHCDLEQDTFLRWQTVPPTKIQVTINPIPYKNGHDLIGVFDLIGGEY